MKKLFLVILCCFLWACQKQEVKTSQKQNTEKEDLIYKTPGLIGSGSGDANGYYEIRNRDDEGANISYYDYKTKQEVYLCNKPECQHNDETCTSYECFGMMSHLILYKDYLYIIDNRGLKMNTLGQREESGPIIKRRNLDGSHPQDIYVAKEGQEFEFMNAIVADNQLYIVTYKKQMYKTQNKSQIQVDKEKKLIAIDLTTGEAKEICDFNDRRIVSVDGRSIIISQMVYEEDPMQYLEKNDFKKYDQLMLKGKTTYFKLNIDTLEESKSIFPKSNDIAGYDQGYLYFTEKDGIYSVDLETGERQKLISYNKSYSYYAQYLADGYIVLNEHKNDKNYTFLSSYVVNIKNPEMKKIPFATRSPKEPVMIISENSDSFLVKYDREGSVQKTWAGTDQYEETKQYIGIIKKSDFFNGTNKLENIKLLK